MAIIEQTFIYADPKRHAGQSKFAPSNARISGNGGVQPYLPIMKQIVSAAFAAALMTLPLSATAETVGEVGVDWVGNDILIEAIEDPEVEGITCHIAYFDRSFLDRLSQGNWFEDPSNSAIACRQTGPIVIHDIDRSRDGENVFRQSRSIILKNLRVKRIYDEENQVLIYLSHATELSEGSAKMSLSTVPLYGADVTWAGD